LPFHPKRILVVRTDRIGDVVLATPLIRSLRKSFPEAMIAAMVRPYAAPVLLHNPHLNEILLDDEDRGWRGFFRQVRRIAAHRFDTALILLPKSRLSWMLFLAGVPRRVSVELRLDHVLTFTRWVSRHGYTPLRHETEYCLDLGRKIGARDDGLDVEVFVTEEEQASARRMLASAGVDLSGRLVGIHPVSGGSAPNWTRERYRELAAILVREPGVQVVLTGTPDDMPVLSHVAAAAPDQIIALPSHDLRLTIGLLSLLRVLVSASTGPMHLAAGLKVPTVSLFCPLTACSPALWGPLGNSASVILPEDGFCQNRCPGDPHVCTFEGGIAPDVVARAVLHTLNAGPSVLS